MRAASRLMARRPYCGCLMRWKTLFFSGAVKKEFNFTLCALSENGAPRGRLLYYAYARGYCVCERGHKYCQQRRAWRDISCFVCRIMCRLLPDRLLISVRATMRYQSERSRCCGAMTLFICIHTPFVTNEICISNDQTASVQTDKAKC